MPITASSSTASWHPKETSTAAASLAVSGMTAGLSRRISTTVGMTRQRDRILARSLALDVREPCGFFPAAGLKLAAPRASEFRVTGIPSGVRSAILRSELCHRATVSGPGGARKLKCRMCRLTINPEVGPTLSGWMP